MRSQFLLKKKYDKVKGETSIITKEAVVATAEHIYAFLYWKRNILL
jgi:hypothetical protein